MNKYYSQVKKHHIISVDNSVELARFKNIIFDYTNWSILAIVVKQINFFSYKEKVVLPRDIIKWTDNLYVQNNNDVCEVEDIIRLRNIYYDYVYLINLPVVTVSGYKLGHVRDYTFCNKTFQLKKLIVNKQDISSMQIVSIDREKIIVKDTVISIEEDININSLTPEMSY